jgi:hypothetical protein
MAVNFSLCHTSLDKIGKITLGNVSKANETTLNVLRQNTPLRLKELAQLNCFAADKIKTELDKAYGTNNYAVVAIGRSLSSIAELLGSMGVDSKIIPLSGLRRHGIEGIKKDDLHIYKTFLAQKGLSKAEIRKNQEKKYILMDYTYYGRSLKKAEELLRKKEILGNFDNLISLSISEVLKKEYEGRHFSKLFACNRFKDYAFVGRLDINRLQDVFKVCSPDRVKDYQGNINQTIRKLFWFNVFDSLIKKDFKNVMPINEIAALNKHYYSPEAVNNYLKREMEKMQNAFEVLSALR